jgi:hypothetical protein
MGMFCPALVNLSVEPLTNLSRLHVLYPSIPIIPIIEVVGIGLRAAGARSVCGRNGPHSSRKQERDRKREQSRLAQSRHRAHQHNGERVYSARAERRQSARSA